MPTTTWGTIKNRAAASLHGASLNRISYIADKARQAAAIMLGRIDPPDTIRRYRISNALYDQVYNYTAPTDLKGTTRILDLRPIGPRSKRDAIDQVFIREFDIQKKSNSLAIEVINGVKTLRASKRVSPGMELLADLGSYNVPATVSLSGDASNVSQNTLDYVTGNGSTQFDLSGSTGQGVITIQLPAGMDISSMLDLGSLFNWINFPDVTRLTNIEQRWGTNASAYWKKQVTAPNDRSAFESQAWTNQRFDWQSATKVGSPDSTNINWLQIIFNYTTGAALTGVKVDSITASLGMAYELLYYSKNIFQTLGTGTTFTDIPVNDSDIVFLDSAAETIFFYEFLKICATDIKGKNMGTDIQRYVYELEGDGRVMRGMLVANRAGLYRDYTGQNPSQVIPPSMNYYQFDTLDGSGDCDVDSE